MSLTKQLLRAPLSAKFGLLVIVLYVLVALFAPALAPYGETEIVGDGFAPWGGQFLLGTDNLGRDMFTRLVYGARNTLGIAFLTTVLAFAVGGFCGLVAAIKGGWIDQGLSRTVDILMAIPQLIFALLILSVVGTTATSLVLVIALLTLPPAIAALGARSLWRMLVVAILLNVAFVFVGLGLSFSLDLPSGPSVILIAALVYLFVNGFSRLWGSWKPSK